MNPKTEAIIDWFIDNPTRAFALVMAVLIAMLFVGALCEWRAKPTYQDMAEQTIIVQTGTTECHYVPAWQAVSCVTLPRTYGPAAPPVIE